MAAKWRRKSRLKRVFLMIDDARRRQQAWGKRGQWTHGKGWSGGRTSEIQGPKERGRKGWNRSDTDPLSTDGFAIEHRWTSFQHFRQLGAACLPRYGSPEITVEHVRTLRSARSNAALPTESAVRQQRPVPSETSLRLLRRTLLMSRGGP
jgi:hypothetical protein